MEVPGSGPIIDSGVSNAKNTHSYAFTKKFNLNIKSHKYQFKKVSGTNGVEVSFTPYVHSLPWNFLYFYLTEKEFDDIRATNNEARVKSVSVKIVNLGNRTPFVTGQNTVSFANSNSQTTIGIWEQLESLGPVTLGSNITPTILYGTKLKDLPSAATSKDIAKENYGATAQAVIVDNRVTYNFKATVKVNNDETDLNDGNFYIPSMIMQAKTLFNATNSVGPIYQKTYTPADGTFHSINNAFFTSGIQQRPSAPPFDLNQTTGAMTETAITREYLNLLPDYTTVTIDNIMFNSHDNNSGGGFAHSIGIGIVPLLNLDSNIENAILNFIVETRIIIEGTSHGTNLLMGKSINYPQPNIYDVGLISHKRKFTNAFGICGKPITGEKSTERHEPDDEEINETPHNAWSDNTTPATLEIHGVTVAGQKRIMGRMTRDQRRKIVEYNLKVRQDWKAAQEAIGSTVTFKSGGNLQYGIPEDPNTIPATTDNWWTKIYSVGGNAPAL